MADQDVACPVRVCTKCGVAYPATAEFFSRIKSGADCLKAECKSCASLRHAEWRSKNIERVREKRAASKPQEAAQFLEWYAANKARRIAKVREWQARNPERVREAKRSSGKRTYERRKASGDPRLFSFLVRTAVRKHVRKFGLARPKAGWWALLDFTPAELVKHIERQFAQGMTWDRFAAGEIHIDHIIPLSSFTITGPECPEFRAAWSLTNLRPLWARDNLKKGARRTLLL